MSDFDSYEPHLSRIARLASSRHSLMSSLMQLYREQEGMDDEQLAAFLECDVDALPRLALCRRPRQAPNFRGDIEAIAAHAQANSACIARMVRAAEATEAMKGARYEVSSSTMLMAARDHDDENAPAATDEANEDDSP